MDSHIARERMYAVKHFNELPQRILQVVNRLKNVQIDNQDAVKLIARHNKADVLIYADPPYVLNTRSGRQYKHEMQDIDHVELITALNNHTGPVLLSGYNSELYNDLLSGWEKTSINTQAELGLQRTEVLWLNPVAAEEVWRLKFFSG